MAAVPQTQGYVGFVPATYFTWDKGRRALAENKYVNVSKSDKKNKPPTNLLAGNARAIRGALRKAYKNNRNRPKIYIGYKDVAPNPALLQGRGQAQPAPEYVRMAGYEDDVRRELATYAPSLANELLAKQININNVDQLLANELEQGEESAHVARLERVDFNARFKRVLAIEQAILGLGQVVPIERRPPKDTGKAEAHRRKTGILGNLMEVLSNPQKVVDLSGVMLGTHRNGTKTHIVSRETIAGKDRQGITNLPAFPFVSSNAGDWDRGMDILASVTGRPEWRQFKGLWNQPVNAEASTLFSKGLDKLFPVEGTVPVPAATVSPARTTTVKMPPVQTFKPKAAPTQLQPAGLKPAAPAGTQLRLAPTSLSAAAGQGQPLYNVGPSVQVLRTAQPAAQPMAQPAAEIAAEQAQTGLAVPPPEQAAPLETLPTGATALPAPVPVETIAPAAPPLQGTTVQVGGAPLAAPTGFGAVKQQPRTAFAKGPTGPQSFRPKAPGTIRPAQTISSTVEQQLQSPTKT